MYYRMANKKSLALTKEQYENLIGSMRKGGNTFRANDRIATALVLEANLGLRIGDILKLRLQDIVLDGGRYRLDITEEKTQKKNLIDFYVLPHYLTAPFKKVTEKIMTEFSDLNLCPINNRQGIVIDGEGSKVICKD